MVKSLRLVFFGTEDFSLPSLISLVDNGFKIVSVVTKPDSRSGRGRQVKIPEVKQYALKKHIPVLQPDKLRDIEDELVKLEPEAGILVSYGKIIPERTLNLFNPYGVINLHPSRLPRYRGPSPIEATIINDDKSTAVTIMKLDKGMDTGPIFSQTEVPLSGRETKPELSRLLAQKGAVELVRVLPAIFSGTLKPQPQENDDVIVTSLISKNDGYLRPEADTAEMCERKVRAFLGFPKTRLKTTSTDVIVTSVEVVNGLIKNEFIIPCANDTWLKIDQLIAPSGRTMGGREYMLGHKV